MDCAILNNSVNMVRLLHIHGINLDFNKEYPYPISTYMARYGSIHFTKIENINKESSIFKEFKSKIPEEQYIEILKKNPEFYKNIKFVDYVGEPLVKSISFEVDGKPLSSYLLDHPEIKIDVKCLN